MNKTMKKRIALLALSVSLTGGAASAWADSAVPVNEPLLIAQGAQQMNITVDNEGLKLSGYQAGGAKEAMLPLRAVADALGYQVLWNEESRTVELNNGSIRTSLKAGEDRYTVNKMYKSLGAAPELVNELTYVPASFFSEVLQTRVQTEGDKVAISSMMSIGNLVAKGFITAVKDVEGHQSVRINGVQMDGLVLNISGDTVIEASDGSKLAFADLKPGQEIRAEHSMVMTMSLPPQTPAYKITVMSATDAKALAGAAGVIEEVRTGDNGTVSLRIQGAGLEENTPSEVVLRLSDETELLNADGEPVQKSDFVKGAKVIGFYNGILTRSLPPIGTAEKLVLQEAPSE